MFFWHIFFYSKPNTPILYRQHSIHPWNYGNGRSARLLEKWFLARKLDISVWSINSEKYYHDHLSEYYKNLEDVGFFYDNLDYGKANDFLGMLPKAVSYE